MPDDPMHPLRHYAIPMELPHEFNPLRFLLLEMRVLECFEKIEKLELSVGKNGDGKR